MRRGCKVCAKLAEHPGACSGTGRYRLDSDSPAVLRGGGQREQRKLLEKAVSQGRQRMVKVRSPFPDLPTP